MCIMNFINLDFPHLKTKLDFLILQLFFNFICHYAVIFKPFIYSKSHLFHFSTKFKSIIKFKFHIFHLN